MGQFIGPCDIAINSKGAIYVCDSGNSRIVQLQIDGRNAKVISSIGVNGESPGMFIDPRGIDIDSNDDIYVADTSNHRVQVINKNGKFKFLIGSFGASDGQFRFPYDVAVSKHGYIYVADMGNDRIQQFDMYGNFIGKTGNYTVLQNGIHCSSIACDASGRVYASVTGENIIYVFDSSLSTVLSTCKGDTSGPFYKLNGINISIVVDEKGTYVKTDAISVAEDEKVSFFGIDKTLALGPIVQINNIIDNDVIKENSIVEIIGTAKKGMFSFGGYKLEYGIGFNPTKYYIIQQITKSEVDNGLLGKWDTRNLVAGDYTVKLTAQSRGGLISEISKIVKIKEFGLPCPSCDAFHILPWTAANIRNRRSVVCGLEGNPQFGKSRCVNISR